MGRAQNDLSINRGVAQHPLSDPQRGWRADPLLFPGLGYWWLCLELEGIDPDRKTFVPRDGDSLDRGADAQSQVERGFSTRTPAPMRAPRSMRPYVSQLAGGGVRGRPLLGADGGHFRHPSPKLLCSIKRPAPDTTTTASFPAWPSLLRRRPCLPHWRCLAWSRCLARPERQRQLLGPPPYRIHQY